MSLFSLVHEAGLAPSDRSALASVAVQHGVFPSLEEALRFLDSDECDAEVKRAYTMARRVGVTGVPFFVFQDRYAASGAMGVDEFVKVSGRGVGVGVGRGGANNRSWARRWLRAVLIAVAVRGDHPPLRNNLVALSHRQRRIARLRVIAQHSRYTVLGHIGRS